MPPPCHVLLVDDHPEVRAILTRLVTRLCPDATIAEAADGAAALCAVAIRLPDLIITDYQMPIPDGLAVVRTLRAQGATLPIMVTSSDPRVSETVLRAGADAFLLKPFRLAECMQLLRTLLPACNETRAVGQ